MESPREVRVARLIQEQRLQFSPEDDVDDVLTRLRSQKAYAYDAIMVIEQLFSLTFGESKAALHRSAAWADITRDSVPIQDAAEHAARELSDGS